MKLLFAFLFSLIQWSLFAQAFTGVVLDKNKQPIPEVTILNKNNDQHTHSNAQGKFILENISIGDSLQFYHISYEPQTIFLNKLQNSYAIVLVKNAIDLSEVMISPRINALQMISDIDIQTAPVNSS